MSPPLVDHTAIDYHAPPSDPSRAPTTHAPAHACILRPVGSDDEQLLFPEGWKHSLRTRTMLILSPRSPCTHSPHTTHTQPSAPMPRGRPARAHAPAVKSDLYSWESILRGKLEMGSALPWVHFLTILCTSSWAIPPSSQSLPIFLPSPLLIHLVHLNRSDRLLRSRHFPLLGSSSKVQPAPCVAASFAPLPQPPARCTQPALILRRGPTFPWLCYSTTEW